MVFKSDPDEDNSQYDLNMSNAYYSKMNSDRPERVEYYEQYPVGHSQDREANSKLLAVSTGFTPYYNRDELTYLNGSGIGQWAGKYSRDVANDVKKHSRRLEEETQPTRQKVARDIKYAKMKADQEIDDYLNEVNKQGLSGGKLSGSKIKKVKVKGIKKAFKDLGKKLNDVTDDIKEGVQETAYKADRDTRGMQADVKYAAIQTGDSFKEKSGIGHKLVTNVINEAVKEGSKVVVDQLATALSPALGPAAPILAPLLAKVIVNPAVKTGRDELKEKTGYGYYKNKQDMYDAMGGKPKTPPPRNRRTGGGQVKLKELLDKFVPDDKPDEVTGRKPNNRNQVVKMVMQEMNLSLPEASKYVKENNLY